MHYLTLYMNPTVLYIILGYLLLLPVVYLVQERFILSPKN